MLSFRDFYALIFRFLGQDMLHVDIKCFTDSSLVDLPRNPQALPGECSDIDSSGSVKQFVAADLPTSPAEASGREKQLSSAMYPSNTRSGKSSGGLSPPNMVCEAYSADGLVKHIVD